MHIAGSGSPTGGNAADLVATAYAKNDGITDATVGLQNWINAVSVTTGRGYLPSGTYLISAPLVISKPCYLYGAGMFSSVIKAAAGVNAYMIQMLAAGTGASNLTGASIMDMTLDGNNPAQTASAGCLLGRGLVHCQFVNVRFTRGTDFAVWLQGTTGGVFGHNNVFYGCLIDNGNTVTGTTNNGGGLHINSCDENFIINTDFEFNGNAAAANGYSFLDEAGIQYVFGCNFVGGFCGFKMNNAPGSRIVGCHFDVMGGNQVTLVGTGAVIEGCSFFETGSQLANNYSNIFMGFAGGSHTISGCTFRTALTGNTPVARSFIREGGVTRASVISGNAFDVNLALGTAIIEDGNVGTLYRNNVPWPDTPLAMPIRSITTTTVLPVGSVMGSITANNLSVTLPDATQMVSLDILLVNGNNLGTVVHTTGVQTLLGLTSSTTLLANPYAYLRVRSLGSTWGVIAAGATIQPTQFLAITPVFAHATSAATVTGAITQTSVGALSLGAYIVVPSSPNDLFVESNPSIMDDFATKVGRMPACVNFGSTVGLAWVNAQFDSIRTRGAMPMYTMMPTGTCQDIVSGNHDAFFTSFAQAANAWGHPYYLRFAHEMNGDWYSYGYLNGHNGNTPLLYKQMWQRVHNLFSAQGNTNTRWVFCVNNSPWDTTSYPGDSFIDYFAMDGYNYGTAGTAGAHTWQTFSSVFNSTYNSLLAVSPKPIIITEIGCVEQGGDKAAWITDAFTQARTNFPKIVAVNWYNAPYGVFVVYVDTTTASLNAYKAVVADPRWQGMLT